MLKLVTLGVVDDAWLSRLEAAIEADGRTPRAISKACGFGPNYLGEVLRKGKMPGVDKLVRLCAEIKVSAAYILTGANVTPDSEEMLAILAGLPADRQETLLSLARQLREAGQR